MTKRQYEKLFGDMVIKSQEQAFSDLNQQYLEGNKSQESKEQKDFSKYTPYDIPGLLRNWKHDKRAATV